MVSKKYYESKPQTANEILELKRARFMKIIKYDNDISDADLSKRLHVCTTTVRKWRREADSSI